MPAVAVVRGDSNIKGTVTFEQSSESSPTCISWDITGHDANAERGMHVHQFGDNTNGCTSAGPHCPFSFLTLLTSFLHEQPVIPPECPRIGFRHRTLLTPSRKVNPFGKQHGAPEDSERHVGDLGNFKTDGQGNAKGSAEDKQIKLIGEQSVLGVCLSSFGICTRSSN